MAFIALFYCFIFFIIHISCNDNFKENVTHNIQNHFILETIRPNNTILLSNRNTKTTKYTSKIQILYNELLNIFTSIQTFQIIQKMWYSTQNVEMVQIEWLFYKLSHFYYYYTKKLGLSHRNTLCLYVQNTRWNIDRHIRTFVCALCSI